MGDPREIGVELNKEHNPFIGWIWRITHIALVLFMIVNIFILGSISLITIFSSNNIRSIPKGNVKGYDLDDNIIYEEEY